MLKSWKLLYQCDSNIYEFIIRNNYLLVLNEKFLELYSMKEHQLTEINKIQLEGHQYNIFLFDNQQLIYGYTSIINQKTQITFIQNQSMIKQNYDLIAIKTYFNDKYLIVYGNYNKLLIFNIYQSQTPMFYQFQIRSQIINILSPNPDQIITVFQYSYPILYTIDFQSQQLNKVVEFQINESLCSCLYQNYLISGDSQLQLQIFNIQGEKIKTTYLESFPHYLISNIITQPYNSPQQPTNYFILSTNDCNVSINTLTPQSYTPVTSITNYYTSELQDFTSQIQRSENKNLFLKIEKKIFFLNKNFDFKQKIVDSGTQIFNFSIFPQNKLIFTSNEDQIRVSQLNGIFIEKYRDCFNQFDLQAVKDDNYPYNSVQHKLDPTITFLKRSENFNQKENFFASQIKSIEGFGLKVFKFDKIGVFITESSILVFNLSLDQKLQEIHQFNIQCEVNYKNGILIVLTLHGDVVQYKIQNKSIQEVQRFNFNKFDFQGKIFKDSRIFQLRNQDILITTVKIDQNYNYINYIVCCDQNKIKWYKTVQQSVLAIQQTDNNIYVGSGSQLVDIQNDKVLMNFDSQITDIYLDDDNKVGIVTMNGVVYFYQ